VQKTDIVFLKHFAQVIAGLFVLMLLLIAAAWWIYDRQGFNAVDPAADTQLQARIAPVGAVFAGESGRAAMLAAQEAAKAAAAASVAFDGALDGALIYQNVCSACHANAVAGAPAPTAAAWAPRIAQGLDILVKHAVEGFQGQAGLMPAKGGRADLTDEQVKVTVEYMIAKYQ
jgi:cytochrome c5